MTYVIAPGGLAFLILLVGADKVADLSKQRLAFHCSAAWLILGKGEVPGGRVRSRRLDVGALTFQDCRLTRGQINVYMKNWILSIGWW